MSNPIRIYVLHHPASQQGKELTDRLYDWFRMPSLEGIPVYIRSAPPDGQAVPDEPSGQATALEYIVPLVDAHMVRDVAWHDYLVSLVTQCLPEHDAATRGWVMFPVALDNTAFNLPSAITQRNFVRFILDAPVTPATAAPEEKPTPFDRATARVQKDLTEAMSRDLNARLFPKQAGRKLKIFISYARADTATIPKLLRDYIQGQTQCEAFFDENDIGFGSKYETILSESAGEHARALIVVVGDHYAERPVCRWEIRKFTQSDTLPISISGKKKSPRHIRVFHPLMVCSTLSGQRITRVVPELGQAPTIHWGPGHEMLCFSMLMREVLFGARNVLAAQNLAAPTPSGLPPAPGLPPGLILNRLPGPVALQRLLDEHKKEARGEDGHPQIHYPGNGLPLMELRLLERTFKNTRFTAFRDVEHHLPDNMSAATAQHQRPLHEKVIAISYGFSDKLNTLGYLPQHQEECLIYLLRPLLRLGADIMYGGLLPLRSKTDPGTGRNMTLILMNLLNDELSIAGIDGGTEEKQKGKSKAGKEKETEPTSQITIPSRLFNPASWPATNDITPEDEATWINTCSVIQFLPRHTGHPSLTGGAPAPDTPAWYACQGLVLSQSREKMATGFDCPVPGTPRRHVTPAASVFMGGKTAGFSGSMPGIMEEFYWALKNQRPIYLLGGFGGAATVLAQAITGKATEPPAPFHTSHYQRDKNYSLLLQGYEQLSIPPTDPRHPEARLTALWSTLSSSQAHAPLFNNGLSEKDNHTLLTTTDTIQAVHLIWQGLSQLISSSEP